MKKITIAVDRDTQDAFNAFLLYQTDFHAMEAARSFMIAGAPIPATLVPYVDKAMAEWTEKHVRKTKTAKNDDRIRELVFNIAQLVYIEEMDLADAIDAVIVMHDEQYKLQFASLEDYWNRKGKDYRRVFANDQFSNEFMREQKANIELQIKWLATPEMQKKLKKLREDRFQAQDRKDRL